MNVFGHRSVFTSVPADVHYTVIPEVPILGGPFLIILGLVLVIIIVSTRNNPLFYR